MTTGVSGGAKAMIVMITPVKLEIAAALLVKILLIDVCVSV
jgi:hypothetical protein